MATKTVLKSSKSFKINQSQREDKCVTDILNNLTCERNLYQMNTMTSKHYKVKRSVEIS